MAVKVKKDTPGKMYLKMSHLDNNFKEVTLAEGRRHSINQEMPYEGSESPKLSEDKHTDLMKLIDGPNPVIKHRDHVQFYRLLPH